MTEKTAEYYIEKLNLLAHPEGGYYAENYRSEESIKKSALPNHYPSARTFGTSIYFLLTPNSVSNFHRLNSDEIWHFHDGGGACIHMLSPGGNLVSKTIGKDLEKGEQFQVVIPKHHWFAAEIIRGDFILVGCTVSPGFEFEDFELADRSTLASAYPDHKTLIKRFTKA
ncbi:cupin domain-containing protein [Roseivirga sp.]|uniref:cupin domain-containing protein n=1 Tax=Roseivirga sp. TaxID=1964215 RepID=UPI002B27533D|nr:cupin domain-containing protein [Roseivirga sp.]